MIWERTDPYRRVRDYGIKNAIVFIRTGTGTILKMPAKDLIRNDLSYQNSVLYALDYGDMDLKLMRFYPKRTYYLYFYEKTLRRGFLIPLLPYS